MESNKARVKKREKIKKKNNKKCYKRRVCDMWVLSVSNGPKDWGLIVNTFKLSPVGVLQGLETTVSHKRAALLIQTNTSMVVWQVIHNLVTAVLTKYLKGPCTLWWKAVHSMNKSKHEKNVPSFSCVAFRINQIGGKPGYSSGSNGKSQMSEWRRDGSGQMDEKVGPHWLVG